jgi:hypothetical protein
MSHFVTGAAAGVLATAVGHPIDTIVVLQSKGEPLAQILGDDRVVPRLLRGMGASCVETAVFNGFNFGV